ncbi:hypothetical protein EDD29_0044 [Actinocorallia herbida]|uniref:Uncharacterized protein n=1 Tax=Actinocorallia herbida TaxID=58109 RepID=A0A3N1CN43_9ACTN|nr:hypothetical protein [Actinocorallia herbida]ROO82564.1 hypothetical protein EDD29_0044 [Actinocorallia herbida]
MIKFFSLRFETARALYALNALLALLVSFGLPLSDAKATAITAIVTGGLSIIVVIQTRPIVVSGIASATTTILTSVAAFGYELTADQVGGLVTVLSLLLAAVLGPEVASKAKLAQRD